MPQGRRSGRSFDPFFRALRASVLAAWTDREGYAYDRVIYAVGYPYRAGDLERVLAFAGRKDEVRRFPPLAQLNRLLLDSVYPELCGQAPEGVSAEAWSAVLHFLDPSYPLATPSACRALAELGFNVREGLSASDYPHFVAAVDELKAEAPVWAVPETNWFLARVIEVGLEAFAPARTTPTPTGGGGRA